mmetsp:Transcript_22595/g.22346  ORF Transcript_22595/g.22346 Transcript_22595/m.22346 type:complete len:144 (-) Transcript_22595:23-454(-)
MMDLAKKVEGVIEEENCQDGDVYYEVSRGYRRVAGDTCVGGVSVDLEPYRFECAADSIGTSGIIIIIVLVVAIAGLLYVRFSEFFIRKWNEFKGLEVFDKVGYFSDLSKAPEGMDEELSEREIGQTAHSLDGNNEEEEFNPRS